MFNPGAATECTRDGRWTAEEHSRFLQGMLIHGRSWTRVAKIVGTRTTVQVRSHAQKYEAKIEKDKKLGRLTAGAFGTVDETFVAPVSSSVDTVVAAPSTQPPRVPNLTMRHASEDDPTSLLKEDLSYAPTTEWSTEISAPAPPPQPMASVTDLMQYEPWAELPGAAKGMASSAARVHDLDRFAHDGMMDMDTSFNSMGSSQSSTSLDEDVWQYLASDTFSGGDPMHFGADLGAADVAPQSFHSFPGENAYGGY